MAFCLRPAPGDPRPTRPPHPTKPFSTHTSLPPCTRSRFEAPSSLTPPNRCAGDCPAWTRTDRSHRAPPHPHSPPNSWLNNHSYSLESRGSGSTPLSGSYLSSSLHSGPPSFGSYSKDQREREMAFLAFIKGGIGSDRRRNSSVGSHDNISGLPAMPTGAAGGGGGSYRHAAPHGGAGMRKSTLAVPPPHLLPAGGGPVGSPDRRLPVTNGSAFREEKAIVRSPVSSWAATAAGAGGVVGGTAGLERSTVRGESYRPPGGAAAAKRDRGHNQGSAFDEAGGPAPPHPTTATTTAATAAVADTFEAQCQTDLKAAAGRGAAPGMQVRHHYQDGDKPPPPLARAASGECKDDGGADSGPQRRSSRAQMQPLRRRDGLPTLPVVSSPPDTCTAAAGGGAAADPSDPSPSLNRRASMNQHLPVAIARPRPTRPTSFVGVFADAAADHLHPAAGIQGGVMERPPLVTPPFRTPRDGLLYSPPS